MLSSDLKFISTPVDEHSIGIAISYRVLLHHTIVRLLESIYESEKFVYPLRLKVSDGLDGSGSHKIYNQQHGSPTFNTKNYILFAFKLLSLKDVSGMLLWENETPNSPFGVRPISLICQKENEENVKFILDTIINPEVTLIEKEGIILPNGQVIVEIKRTMFDGKMSAILSGASGASCQLCTTQFNACGYVKFMILIKNYQKPGEIFLIKMFEKISQDPIPHRKFRFLPFNHSFMTF